MFHLLLFPFRKVFFFWVFKKQLQKVKENGGCKRVKANIENVNFPTQFFLASMFNGLSAIESREVSLNENVYESSVNYNSVDSPDILNI